jgi:hypothetical protein
MYISNETLNSKWDNPKLKLREILNETLTNVNHHRSEGKVDVTSILATIGYINTFCENNGLKKIVINHKNLNKGIHCYEMISNYQSEFLVENTDLYIDYFPSFKYEFKPEKLEEIKKLVLDIKTDIKIATTIKENDKKTIEVIIDELEDELKLKTNDIDSLVGKVTRVYIQLIYIGFDKKEVLDNLKKVMNMLFEANTYINKVSSLYTTGKEVVGKVIDLFIPN